MTKEVKQTKTKDMVAVGPTMLAPEIDAEVFIENRQRLLDIIGKVMQENIDYGIIPGTEGKTLLKPGGEKLMSIFQLAPRFKMLEQKVVQEKGYFYYKYRCVLYHRATETIVGMAERSCSSYEKQWRKQSNYNDLDNTMMAMAQKRAMVAAVTTAVSASEIFKEEPDLREEAAAPGTVTADDNPARVRLLSKMYAVAKERGWEGDQLKKALYQKYQVDSVTKMNDAQLSDAVEYMVKTYEPVGEGEEPQRIGETAEAEGQPKKAETGTASEYQKIEINKKRIFAMAKSVGDDAEKAKDQIKSKFGLESFNDITLEQSVEAIEALKKMEKPEEKQQTIPLEAEQE